jgi:hypothetical protein
MRCNAKLTPDYLYRYVTGTMGEDGPYVAPPEFADELD